MSKIIPIGARLRRQKQQPVDVRSSGKSNVPLVKVSSLDEDIAKLEAELNENNSDSSDSGEDSSGGNDSDTSSVVEDINDGLVAVKSSSGEILALKSALDGMSHT